MTLLAVLLSAMTCMGQHAIDFSKSTNLKAVYDAGLRPWRVRPDETTTLTVSDEQVRIVIPDSRPFDLPVQTATLTVLAGNELAEASFVSQPVSLSDAVEKAREVYRGLGISTEKLEQDVSTISKLRERSAINTVSGSAEKSGIRVDVTLHVLWGFGGKALGKVYVVLGFHPPEKPMKFLTEPIRQPPGYEHVSMDPPRAKSDGKPFPPPELSFEAQKQAIERMKTERSSGEGPSPVAPQK